jgi:FkbM family methyltransferase
MDLAELLRPSRLTIVVDIGANPIDGTPPYKRLLESRLCQVIGFEPQLTALDRLNSRKSDLERYLPYVVGDGAKATLNVCKASGMTSLLTPDPLTLAQFPMFSEWGQVVQQIPMATHRLDEVTEISAIDFLKTDAQGSELAIFKNGRNRLKDTIAVHTEVSFIPLYKDQPLYGEVDAEMRALGFVPHAFASINRRMIRPLSGENAYQALNQIMEAENQIMEADVVYVRGFMHPERMSPEQLKHLATVAHFCYGSFDLAANCIYNLIRTEAVQKDAITRYLTALQKLKPL